METSWPMVIAATIWTNQHDRRTEQIWRSYAKLGEVLTIYVRPRINNCCQRQVPRTKRNRITMDEKFVVNFECSSCVSISRATIILCRNFWQIFPKSTLHYLNSLIFLFLQNVLPNSKKLKPHATYFFHFPVLFRGLLHAKTSPSQLWAQRFYLLLTSILWKKTARLKATSCLVRKPQRFFIDRDRNAGCEWLREFETMFALFLARLI